jgi:hypothetical protein
MKLVKILIKVSVKNLLNCSNLVILNLKQNKITDPNVRLDFLENLNLGYNLLTTVNFNILVT